MLLAENLNKAAKSISFDKSIHIGLQIGFILSILAPLSCRVNLFTNKEGKSGGYGAKERQIKMVRLDNFPIRVYNR